jgi:hypothetical protein
MGRGGDGLAVNISGQHVACCRFEPRSSRRVGILASDMAYGVLFAGFPLSAVGSAFQLRLRPALVYKVYNPLPVPNG